MEDSKQSLLKLRVAENGVGQEQFKKSVLSFLVGGESAISPTLLQRSCVVTTSSSFATYRLIAEFLRFTRLCPQVFLPFCGNSIEHVVRYGGLRGTQYRVFDHRTGDWQLGGTCEDLLLAGTNSCFLLPFNGSAPFSIHLRPQEWRQITDICRERHHLLWLDVNLFGLAGSPEGWQDQLHCMQTILESGATCILSLSLEHSLGLYGNDLGLVVCVDGEDEVNTSISAVEATLQRCSWELGVNGSRWMEQVVGRVFGSPMLIADWQKECESHRSRFEHIRAELEQICKQHSTPSYCYQYLRKQTGPFSRVPRYRNHNEQLMTELGRYGICNLSSIVDCRRDCPQFPTSFLST